MPDVGVPAFWEEIYARGGDGWELGQPAPALVDVVEHTPPPSPCPAAAAGTMHDSWRDTATR